MNTLSKALVETWIDLATTPDEKLLEAKPVNLQKIESIFCSVEIALIYLEQIERKSA
jgi:hypothetical protein